jgi:tocopherol O-methyltransferase
LRAHASSLAAAHRVSDVAMTDPATLEGIQSYYRNMTWHYNAYASGAYGWHYGLYDRTARSPQQAILNSNRKLVSGVRLGPDSRVLDVGCGVGGFATWAARQFGCHVLGITVVPSHVTFAQELAARRGVPELCRFALMDLNDLRLEPASFDLVVNQETLVYALDKPAYFKQLFRLLKWGGRWQSIDFSIKEGALSAEERETHRVACEQWYMAPLAPASAVKAAVLDAEFARFTSEDVTPLVLAEARRILRVCSVAWLLGGLRVDRLLYRDPCYRADLKRHFAAGTAYSRGLIHGPFRHHFYAASKEAMVRA